MPLWRYETSKIVKQLGGKILFKKSVTINEPSTISNAKSNSIIFVTAAKWKESYLDNLAGISNAMIIIEQGIEGYIDNRLKNNQIIVCSNARLYFAKAMKQILDENGRSREYVTNNRVTKGENITIGIGCIIEPGVFLDHDVKIGDNVCIKTGAVIRSNVSIGNNVVIGENTVIGAQGFGIETDENGLHVRIPHIGGVIIGNNVEIGALTSIVSGTIEPTIIGENCFIDDLNHIAHNCKIDKGTMTTACVQIGGSACIGKDSYIAPNSTIRNGISLGDNCFVGQASSVQKNVEDDKSVVGNPSKEFVKRQL